MISKLRSFAKTLTPAMVMKSRLHQKVFVTFAEKMGLVHFGFVDQHRDEHRVVRGFTMSPRHRDDNYCIGNYKDYEVALVERSDIVTFPRKPARSYNWIIMEFPLKTKQDLPHIFLGLRSHDQSFYTYLFTKYSSLTKVPLGTFGPHAGAFSSRYVVFADPAKLIETEQLFTPEITAIIVERFGNLTIEVAENNLYIYSEHESPSEALLERMLKYGVWLAESVDGGSSR